MQDFLFFMFAYIIFGWLSLCFFLFHNFQHNVEQKQDAFERCVMI